MNEAMLDCAELAYLFATLDISSVMGVDNAALFPEDPAARERIYEAGLKLLHEHQWIKPGKEAGRENLDAELLLMVEAMARAPLVMITERRAGQDGPRSRVVHYLTDHTVIEQVYQEGQHYHLVEMADLQTTVLRIISTIGVPESNAAGEHLVKVNEPVFAKIKELLDGGESTKVVPALKKLGMDEATAADCVDTIARPMFCGTVSLTRLQRVQITDARVLAYFVGQGSCWLVTKPDVSTNEITLQRAVAATVWQLLTGYLTSLMEPATEMG